MTAPAPDVPVPRVQRYPVMLRKYAELPWQQELPEPHIVVLAADHDIVVAEMLAELERWRALIPPVVFELENKGMHDGNAPGHGHDVPGVWDSDNGALAGTECAWCKLWKTVTEMVKP